MFEKNCARAIYVLIEFYEFNPVVSYISTDICHYCPTFVRDTKYGTPPNSHKACRCVLELIQRKLCSFLQDKNASEVVVVVVVAVVWLKLRVWLFVSEASFVADVIFIFIRKIIFQKVNCNDFGMSVQYWNIYLMIHDISCGINCYVYLSFML